MDADEATVGELIERLGAIGATASGGVTRLGLTEHEHMAMEVVRERLESAGLQTSYDQAFNLRARWDGAQDGTAPVLTGSHLDSVVEGGRFDGAGGVVCAVAAVEAMRRAGVEPQRPIEVIVFTSEEGSRFGAGLLGSTALVRGLDDEKLERTDPEGVSVAEALRRAGGDPDQLREPSLREGDVHAFVEVHIEQGTILEELDAPVGVVTGIAAPVFLRVEFTGAADHAGATPMDRRRDALLGAAEVALAAERIAIDGATTVATVGSVTVHPGATNIIPGLCTLTVDLRDLDADARRHAEERLVDTLRGVAERRGLRWQIETLQREEPVVTDDAIRDALGDAIRASGVGDAVQLPSRAAHDAMVIADIAPVGMLFVRCLDGRSHCPEEHASSADLTVAASVLARTLARLSA